MSCVGCGTVLPQHQDASGDALVSDLSDPNAVRLCKSRHGHYSTVARLHAIGVRRHILLHGTCCGQSENELEWLVRIRTIGVPPVSYTHLRAHETDSYLVCRLLLEKKKT